MRFEAGAIERETSRGAALGTTNHQLLLRCELIQVRRPNLEGSEEGVVLICLFHCHPRVA